MFLPVSMLKNTNTHTKNLYAITTCIGRKLWLSVKLNCTGVQAQQNGSETMKEERNGYGDTGR